jgi:hypothetical protein
MNAPNSPVSCVTSDTHSVSGPPTLTYHVVAHWPANDNDPPTGQDPHSSLFYTLSARGMQVFLDSSRAIIPVAPGAYTDIPALPDQNASFPAPIAVARARCSPWARARPLCPHRAEPSIEASHRSGLHYHHTTTYLRHLQQSKCRFSKKNAILLGRAIRQEILGCRHANPSVDRSRIA